MDARRPHVWVETANGTPQWPALVMEWRQTLDGEWEARIAVLTKSNTHGPYDTRSPCAGRMRQAFARLAVDPAPEADHLRFRGGRLRDTWLP